MRPRTCEQRAREQRLCDGKRAVPACGVFDSARRDEGATTARVDCERHARLCRDALEVACALGLEADAAMRYNRFGFQQFGSPRPNCVSSAAQLMGVTPGTAREFGCDSSHPPEARLFQESAPT